MSGPSVVHVVPALFGEDGVYGGAERYAYGLARAMSAQVPTRIVAFGERAARRQDGRLDVRLLRRIAGGPFNPVSPWLPAALHGCDVIHVHQTHTWPASIALATGFLTRRRVFTTDLGGGGRSVYSVLDADRFFAGHLHLSAYSRKVFGHERLPSAAVIYGGVDLEFFRPQAGPRRREVLFVGRLMPHKGIDVLLDALPAGLALRIVGRAAGVRPDYVQLLRDKARGKAVTFVEDADDAALLEAYRSAACLVLPSVYRTALGGRTEVPELLGQTLLEAMACGTPVICTDVASMPELVTDGVDGYVVPPNDAAALGRALLKLCDDPEHARALGAAGRRKVEATFNWPATVARCLDAYGR